MGKWVPSVSSVAVCGLDTQCLKKMINFVHVCGCVQSSACLYAFMLYVYVYVCLYVCEVQ